MSSEEETRSIGKELYTKLQNKCNPKLLLSESEEQIAIAKLLYKIPDETIRRLVKKQDKGKEICPHCNILIEEHNNVTITICNAWISVRELMKKKYPRVDLSSYFESTYEVIDPNYSQFVRGTRIDDYTRLVALIQYSLLRDICMYSQGRLIGHQIDKNNPKSVEVVKKMLHQSRTARHKFTVVEEKID